MVLCDAPEEMHAVRHHARCRWYDSERADGRAAMAGR